MWRRPVCGGRDGGRVLASSRTDGGGSWVGFSWTGLGTRDPAERTAFAAGRKVSQAEGTAFETRKGMGPGRRKPQGGGKRAGLATEDAGGGFILWTMVPTAALAGLSRCHSCSPLCPPRPPRGEGASCLCCRGSGFPTGGLCLFLLRWGLVRAAGFDGLLGAAAASGLPSGGCRIERGGWGGVQQRARRETVGRPAPGTRGARGPPRAREASG